ncbi:MAG TPA: septal ring lytic transglycosylase RlpA family protein, partial [Burkholderiales bacterium]|nr:septal ring lytic transglycosylase RlpA family protein [Burkholderiales bacterium]
MKRLAFFALALLAGCSAAPPHQDPALPPSTPADAVPPAQAKGGYYKDDGPHDNPPSNLAQVPDAVPRAEPLHRYANRPYTQLGRNYIPLTRIQPFKQRGLA